MMRALFAGVSGLRNHQTRLDVIGNNIANVNTIAFKASRVTFEEAFAQFVRGASRPGNGQGGSNPIQIGLGMNIASVDQDFTQGNLESTGVITDLAIQGDGFFVMSDGNSRFYTRAGNFTLDATGRLVAPTNGFAVQGVLADSTGTLPTGAALTDLVLPLGQVSPAVATSEITLTGNLDVRKDPLGTILQTANPVYAVEQATSNGGAGSDINGLYANGTANQQILGMTPSGTTVTVSDGTTTRTYTYVLQDTGPGDLAFNSLNDLVAEINNDFTTMTAALNNTTGAMEITAGAAPITVNLTSSNATLGSALFSANGALAASATAATDEFSHAATSADLLTDLRDGTGASLGVTAGSTILLDGDVGSVSVSQGSLAVGAGTTYQNLLNSVNNTLGLSNAVGATVDTSTGGLIINGDGGTVNALTGINIRVQGGGSPGFDGIFDSRPTNYLETQMATDVVHQLATTVFDSLGNQHVVTVTFTKDPTSVNRWSWQATVPSPSTIVGGDTGVATFDASGRLQTFTYNGGASSFQFDPNAGAALMDIQLNAGTLGDIDGLSQFGAPSNAVVSSQNGHAMGILQDYTIDEQGVVTGIFSNGESQTLARIALADFANPTGMVRRGDGMYDVSANSGDPIIGFVGTTNQSILTPGAIEGSNVDLSREFTSMIIAQRGFQANARVITTADEMLTELVNLKR